MNVLVLRGEGRAGLLCPSNSDVYLRYGKGAKALQ